MRTFVALLGILGVVASSELGYNYPKPLFPYASAYVPGHGYRLGSEFNGYSSSGSLLNTAYPTYSSSLSSGYNLGGNSEFNSGYLSGLSETKKYYPISGINPYLAGIKTYDFSGSQPSLNYASGWYNFGYKPQGQYKISTSSQQAQSTTHQQEHFDIVHQGPPQVFKHIYLHAAPEEPEAPKTRHSIVLPPKQKHYNVIFIKAPTPPAGGSHVLPVQQETEEKTIVYVLTKNPDNVHDVVVPKFTQKLPVKPEVYFVKYDNKEGAHNVIDNIVHDYKGQDYVTFNGQSLANDAVYEGGSDINSGLQNFVTNAAGSLNLPGPLGGFESTSGSKFTLSGGPGTIETVDNSQTGGTSYTITSESGSLTDKDVSLGTNYESSTSTILSSTEAPLAFSTTFKPTTDYSFKYSTLSTSQGLPYKTYGLPLFKTEN